jgi:hypothetical protein
MDRDYPAASEIKAVEKASKYLCPSPVPQDLVKALNKAGYRIVKSHN